MRLWEARAAHAAAIANMEQAAQSGNVPAALKFEEEIITLGQQIDALQRAQAHAAGQAVPLGGTGDPSNPGAFKNLGEQLLAVVRHYGGGATDPRLVRAPSGMGETDRLLKRICGRRQVRVVCRVHGTRRFPSPRRFGSHRIFAWSVWPCC